MTAANFEEHRRSEHILRELGFGVWPAGDELIGTASITPEMLVPGTEVLRASILAAWLDTVAGVRAADALAPKAPVTLGLDLHLEAPPERLADVQVRSRLLKTGRSVVVVEIELLGDGTPIGIGTASFMAGPAATLELPPMAELAAHTREGLGRLDVPFAERARCERREPGVAVIPLLPDGTNASLTMNGGLLALAVEEAALSALAGTTLSSFTMHYLRPVRVGPATARAVVRGDVARVEVTDAGADDRLAVAATVRSFGAPR